MRVMWKYHVASVRSSRSLAYGQSESRESDRKYMILRSAPMLLPCETQHNLWPWSLFYFIHLSSLGYQVRSILFCYTQSSCSSVVNHQSFPCARLPAPFQMICLVRRIPAHFMCWCTNKRNSDHLIHVSRVTKSHYRLSTLRCRPHHRRTPLSPLLS